MTLFSAIIGLLTLVNLENKEEKLNEKIVYSLLFLILVFRVYFTQQIFVYDISLVSMLLMLPVFMKKYFMSNFSNKVINKKEAFKYLLTLTFPEFFLLVAIDQWNIKKEINVISPENLSDTDEKLLLVANTFWAVSCIFLFMGADFTKTVFILTMLPTIGSLYYKTALEKINLEWMRLNNLGYINKAANKQLEWNLYGSKITKFISRNAYLAMMLELLAIIFLLPVNINATSITLIFLAFFHLSVFFLTGINFWKWVLVNLICLFMLLDSNIQIIDPTLSLSIYAIYTVYFLLVSKIPIGLGWLDSPISKVFKIYLVDKNGTEKRLYPYHIFPFDTIVSQNRMEYFFPELKYTTGCLGSIKNIHYCYFLYKVSKEKSESEAKSIVSNFINSEGKQINVNEAMQKANMFLNFIINNQNKIFTPNKQLARKFLCHIQTKNNEDNKKVILEDITKVKVTFERYFYLSKEQKFVTIDQKEKYFEVQYDN